MQRFLQWRRGDSYNANRKPIPSKVARNENAISHARILILALLSQEANYMVVSTAVLKASNLAAREAKCSA